MSFQDLERGRIVGGVTPRNLDASQDVARGVFQINTAVSTFQRHVNALGTPKDTPELREKLHKMRLHIGQLVKDTSEKLRQASDADHLDGISRSKKIADAKLAKDFQGVLKEFQRTQRLAAERETLYNSAQLPPTVPHFSEPDANYEQSLLLSKAKRQDLVLLDNEIAFNEAIIEERDQGIAEVQKQIGEVNEIFKDLAVLVHEQGTMIDDIGSHVENANTATAQAKSQLVKASKTQRSSSSMSCLLLLIFGIVLLILLVILAV